MSLKDQEPNAETPCQPSNQSTSSAQVERSALDAPPKWLPFIGANDSQNEARQIVSEIFKDGRPQLSLDVYAGLEEWMPSKTVICPVALKMGIKKVKRRSGWWWVPPGVKEPTLAATREDPWAEAPPKGS